ncbi:6-phospho-beta-glucosidase [Paramaledivibacter caminithermalis]|jgi:6-phospho-beta-glucosidase|uniref:6-phospho-beta-glucosidase n=1 Tax=Paramaledivibacter caminithermalis (strain DSM 15212 / CIP 107654 / DViRD3) TaxID=1121301 RepID=A0A1M6PGS5_PARC5|nr:6-phospho-beta-glucosidase [Paramaledivibacter caminithermalis]SHK07155.1 6-phospho-beta-glucosidase [Paramaledivibacter caminithermalis DSM 15212]
MNKGLKIAVIGGGSSYTPELIEGFIKRANELPVKEIYLVDIEKGKEKLDIIYNLTKRMINKAGLDISVYKTLNRKEAIKDADFVVTQLRVGGLEARARDEGIPLRYNVIGQETTGAGGFAKAIRTIPVILDICRDIEELSPDAWLINFTNPAGIITETVLKYTNVKVMGLCNVPIGMVNNVAKLLGVSSNRVRIEFAGLNHMVYGKEIYLDGKNVTDVVLEKLGDGGLINMKNIPDIKWDTDFIKTLKMLPCPYHRYFYLSDDILKEELEGLKKNKGTRAEQVMKIEQELFEKYKNPALDEKPEELEKRGGAYYSDAAVSLISAIHNDKSEIHTVNIRNNGAISSLPNDVVVEINAVINRAGAKPVVLGELPVQINGLIQQVKAYELLTVKAGVTGDYYTALMALTTNPLVYSANIAKKLLDDILLENKDYLPQFN